MCPCAFRLHFSLSKKKVLNLRFHICNAWHDNAIDMHVTSKLWQFGRWIDANFHICVRLRSHGIGLSLRALHLKICRNVDRLLCVAVDTRSGAIIWNVFSSSYDYSIEFVVSQLGRLELTFLFRSTSIYTYLRNPLLEYISTPKMTADWFNSQPYQYKQHTHTQTRRAILCNISTNMLQLWR